MYVYGPQVTSAVSATLFQILICCLASSLTWILCCILWHLQLRKIIQTPDFPSKRNPHLRTKPLEQRRQELEDYIQVTHPGVGLMAWELLQALTSRIQLSTVSQISFGSKPLFPYARKIFLEQQHSQRSGTADRDLLASRSKQANLSYMKQKLRRALQE